MTRMDRRALFASGSAAALLTAVGVSAHAAPQRGGILKAALSGGDRSDTWLTSPSGAFLQAARNAVFETLTEVAQDGTLQPGLAKAWSSEESGRIWRFDLRDDVVFHDGSPLTSQDVTASLQIHGVLAFAKGTAITVELGRSHPAFPFDLARGRMAIFKRSELEGDDLPLNGTGLYRVKRFDPGRSLLGVRVETHRKDGVAGWFDAVELAAINDESVRADAIRDQYVDVADLTQAHDVLSNTDIRLVRDKGNVLAAIHADIVSERREGPAPLDDLRFVERWWRR